MIIRILVVAEVVTVYHHVVIILKRTTHTTVVNLRQLKEKCFKLPFDLYYYICINIFMVRPQYKRDIKLIWSWTAEQRDRCFESRSTHARTTRFSVFCSPVQTEASW